MGNLRQLFEDIDGREEPRGNDESSEGLGREGWHRTAFIVLYVFSSCLLLVITWSWFSPMPLVHVLEFLIFLMILLLHVYFYFYPRLIYFFNFGKIVSLYSLGWLRTYDSPASDPWIL